MVSGSGAAMSAAGGEDCENVVCLACEKKHNLEVAVHHRHGSLASDQSWLI